MEEPQGGNTSSPTEVPEEPGSTTQLRVKVYVLNDRGEWDDRGTGHVCVEYLEVRWRPCGSCLGAGTPMHRTA